MYLGKILLEGRRDDFLNKFKNKFTNQELKDIFMLSRDLSSNHKFLLFLGEVLESGNLDLEMARNTIQKFIKYQKVLSTKDIYQFQSLNDIQDEINNHENKVRRDVKQLEGADQVYENERFTVVVPKTHNASCYYGSGTKWCTASMNGNSHFDKYNQDGKLFYIIDKKAKSDDQYYKVALLNKYYGEQTFYDAKDNAFGGGWILDTPEWEEINNTIQNYLTNNFKREIEIFKDKEAAKLEMERIRQVQNAQRIRIRLQLQDERKETDDWNIDNDTEESNFANAVFEVMTDNYSVIVDEEEGETIYNLVPGEYSHYDLPTFEWLGENDNGMTFAVAEWDDAYRATKDYYESLYDDMGVEAFSASFIESHLDMGKIEEYFEEMYENDIDDSPESYFDESELPLSDEQEKQIQELDEELENLHDLIDETDDTDEVVDAMSRIEDIEIEIDEIKESPEGEPTYEMVQQKVDELMDDVKRDPAGYLRDMGFDITNFVDVESLIEEVIEMDGTGNALSPYDGSENEANINNTWYYVYRIE